MFSNFWSCTNPCAKVSQEPSQLIYTLNVKESPTKEFLKIEDVELGQGKCTRLKKSRNRPDANSHSQFTDRQFPPNPSSLGGSHNHKKITWRRVSQFVSDPILIDLDQDNRFSVISQTDNSYFLSTINVLIAHLCLNNRISTLFDSMEISDRGFYLVRINNRGVAEEVIVDDYFPVYESSRQPVFARPRDGREILEMILEKVWAKVNGSYSNIQYGQPSEVLAAFSCAPCFYLDTNTEKQDFLWPQMIDSSQNQFPTIAASKQKLPSNCGVRPLHTYCVIASYELKTPEALIGRVVKLVSTDNETFNGEYNVRNGAFWDQINTNAKQIMGYAKAEEDGFFFMSLNQFTRYFDSVSICHLRDSYSYNFEKVVSQHRSAYFEVDIDQGEVYFTLHQQSVAGVKTDLTFNGRMTILVARINGDAYEYEISKLEVGFPTLTVRCPSLKKGKYIIYAKCFSKNSVGTYTHVLSVYSQQKAIIKQRKKEQLQSFFQKVFLNHALNNPNKKYLSPNNMNWICSDLLYNEGGFAYIAANVVGTKKLKIQFENRIFQEAGYSLKKPYTRLGKNKVEATEGNPCVIVCKIGNKPPKNLEFPPELKISQTI